MWSRSKEGVLHFPFLPQPHSFRLILGKPQSWRHYLTKQVDIIASVNIYTEMYTCPSYSMAYSRGPFKTTPAVSRAERSWLQLHKDPPLSLRLRSKLQPLSNSSKNLGQGIAQAKGHSAFYIIFWFCNPCPMPRRRPNSWWHPRSDSNIPPCSNQNKDLTNNQVLSEDWGAPDSRGTRNIEK